MKKPNKARKKPKIAALIMAAGSGARLGSDTPKQYLEIGGSSVLRQSIEAFLSHKEIDLVQIVILPTNKKLYQQATIGLALPAPISGDKNNRQESVRKGLEALKKSLPNLVLIHDAARPFIDTRTISSVIKGLKKNRAVIPVIKIKDTIKQTSKNTVSKTIDRSQLVQVQTPQGFDFKTIFNLHKKYKGSDFTDDASLAEKEGIKVITVAGQEDNFKITNKEDLKRAENMLQAAFETKVCSGFDVHGFGPVKKHGNHIMLCGIPVVHDYPLIGHSDGDVGLHAIVDAILGTIGEGDIGSHFPSNDNRWKGADSSIFIKRARELLEKKRGKIVHIDVTLLCETPKVSPHRDAMRDRIAELFNIPVHRVSVKATTTDKLGFLGRSEGIAAQAVVTAQLQKEE